MTTRMPPDELAQQYNQIAAKYEQARSASSFGLDYVKRFIALLPVHPTVLEIGCGPGVPVTKQLVVGGANLLAIDISENMIERAMINVPEAAYQKADITKWEAMTQFDGIIAWDSLFHIPLNLQLPTVQKMLHWLNPGGTALFTAGGQRGEIVSDMFDTSFYYSSLSSTEYKRIIQNAGCRLLFDELDDPGSHGHRVICCQKAK